MKELQVVVQQEPGTIEWNFEDLKAALQDELKVYENMIYDDGSIKAAKQDVAMLRKLRESVEDRRKEIKTKCMEPYDVIEKQAKELTGLIDRPITKIAEQVQNYEDQQKAARKEKILAYMAEAFSEFPPAIAKRAQFETYESRWENATAKETEWKTEIDDEAKKVSDEISIIEHGENNGEFREIAMKTYSLNLSIADAMAKLQELHHQQEVILEQQRRQDEERKHREEDKVREEAQGKTAQTQKSEEIPAKDIKQNLYSSETHKNESKEENVQSQPDLATTSPQPRQTSPLHSETNAVLNAVIYLYDANDETLKKVVDYIRFMGLKCETRTRW